MLHRPNYINWHVNKNRNLGNYVWYIHYSDLETKCNKYPPCSDTLCRGLLKSSIKVYLHRNKSYIPSLILVLIPFKMVGCIFSKITLQKQTKAEKSVSWWPVWKRLFVFGRLNTRAKSLRFLQINVNFVLPFPTLLSATFPFLHASLTIYTFPHTLPSCVQNGSSVRSCTWN